MTDTTNLADWAGKDVSILLNGADEYIDGHVEKASEVGLAFKRKGRRDIDPIFPDDIQEIKALEKPATKLKQKKQLPVSIDRVKSHLVTAHGYRLSVVNAMSPEDAENEHNGIDHSDLGHNHNKAEKDDSEAEPSE
jgi:hypothetical protein